MTIEELNAWTNSIYERIGELDNYTSAKLEAALSALSDAADEVCLITSNMLEGEDEDELDAVEMLDDEIITLAVAGYREKPSYHSYVALLASYVLMKDMHLGPAEREILARFDIARPDIGFGAHHVTGPA